MSEERVKKEIEIEDTVEKLESLTNRIKEKETVTKEDVQTFQEDLFAVVKMLENISFHRNAELCTTLLYPVARSIRPVQATFVGKFGFHMFTKKEEIYRELRKWLNEEKRYLMTARTEGTISDEDRQKLKEIKKIMRK